MQEITLARPDDWHLHLRDGAALSDTVAHTARTMGRAIIMPNLLPPVTSTADAQAYRDRIMAHVPQASPFQPLMTLYLTDVMTTEEISRAKESGIVFGVKFYPAGATTNSDQGVTDISKTYPALEKMIELNLPLLIHGEVTRHEVDIYDREKVFIDEVLAPLRARYPGLKIVFEHITTRDAVEFVLAGDQHIAATVTPQHLLFNRNHMLAGGIRPHYYCLPVLKRNVHQQALLDAVASGSPKLFLGTDSAPHGVGKKEAACGCAGCFSSFAALEMYAEIFEQLDSLDKLEAFASFNGPDFYGLPRNQKQITLRKESWTVPSSYSIGSEQVIPLFADNQLSWSIVNE